MSNQTPEDNSVMQLSELMRGLEIPPASASLEPGQLYLIGEAIARQAKEVAAITAQRDELLKCLNLACDDIYTICDAWGATPPEISLTRFRNIIAKCEVQNG